MAASPSNIRETWPQFAAKVEAARCVPNPTAFVEDLQETIYSLESGGVAVVGSYHPGIVSLAKSMHGRYLSAVKGWKILQATPHTLRNNLLTELSLREDQVQIAEGVWAMVEDAFYKATHEDDVHIQLQNYAEPEPSGDAEDADLDVYLAVTSPLAPTDLTEEEIEMHLARYALYDYQVPGVVHLITKSSALLADDMGLGKTRQAIVAGDILGAAGGLGKVLVICPGSLVINWCREIAMVNPGARIAMQKWDESAQWIVTNYERLDGMIQYAAHFRVMIIDEAHLLKEPTSQRTRQAFDIAAKVPYRYILTGTPILNRECEIHTLLRLSGHPIGNIPLKQFEAEFAGDPSFRSDLNKRISEWMLRRKKDVVLKSLKGKQRQTQYVTLADDKLASYRAIARDGSLQAFAKIGKLRQHLEAIKIDSVVETVSELQGDDKVLIFCEFTDTVATLKQRLEDMGIGVVTMIGADSNTKRQKAQDTFQSNPDIRVFIGTTRAAGVGINLTAANYVIFASLPWTPGLRDQAEDRAYRNGQLRLVIVKIPIVEGTIDMDLLEMLKHKQTIAEDIIDPEEAERRGMEVLAMKMAA